MAKLIVTQYVSLDGVVQAPGHPQEDTSGGFDRGGWTGPFMDDHRRLNGELLPSVGALLLGRRTYEIFASYWPTVTDERDVIARALNAMPKHVVSTTLTDPTWQGTTVIDSDVAGAVAQLKQEPGAPIFVIGSSQLAQTLFEHELVDEYQLCLHPVVLGAGKQLFARGTAPATMRLIDSRTTTSGLVLLNYATELA
ncbi:MAG TPA: dihydrofolate reductase family protein [Conexibacter sp.]|nr:dihydrofolate reductase family protein [Conexibacter sp.]